MPSKPLLRKRLLEWSRTDRASGVTLAMAAVAALAWANVDGDGYRHTWASVPSWVELTGLHLSARGWVELDAALVAAGGLCLLAMAGTRVVTRVVLSRTGA
jgi:hypothetical protein